MKPSEALQAHWSAILQIVSAHRVSNPRIFGSVLHGSDTERSDLDILVDPISETTLFDIGAVQHELQKLLGVEVGVVTPNALPDSFRELVLGEAQPIESWLDERLTKSPLLRELKRERREELRDLTPEERLRHEHLVEQIYQAGERRRKNEGES